MKLIDTTKTYSIELTEIERSIISMALADRIQLHDPQGNGANDPNGFQITYQLKRFFGATLR